MFASASRLDRIPHCRRRSTTAVINQCSCDGGDSGCGGGGGGGGGGVALPNEISCLLWLACLTLRRGISERWSSELLLRKCLFLSTLHSVLLERFPSSLMRVFKHCSLNSSFVFFDYHIKKWGARVFYWFRPTQLIQILLRWSTETWERVDSRWRRLCVWPPHWILLEGESQRVLIIKELLLLYWEFDDFRINYNRLALLSWLLLVGELSRRERTDTGRYLSTHLNRNCCRWCNCVTSFIIPIERTGTRAAHSAATFGLADCRYSKWTRRVANSLLIAACRCWKQLLADNNNLLRL